MGNPVMFAEPNGVHHRQLRLLSPSRIAYYSSLLVFIKGRFNKYYYTGIETSTSGTTRSYMKKLTTILIDGSFQ